MNHIRVFFASLAFLGVLWPVISWAAPRAAGRAASVLHRGKPLKNCTGKGSVSFMFWGDKGEYVEQTSLIQEAEKACPGLKVTGIWKQNGYDEALATGIGSGNAPDLFLLDTKRLPEYASQSALQPLASYISRDRLDLKKYFWTNCLPLTMYRKVVYGLERDCGNNGMLIYNKDMFNARHVGYPTNNWSYSAFARAAQRLTGTYTTRTDPAQQARFGTPILTDDPHLVQYLWAWGADWMSADLHRCTLTSASARSALQWWHDLAYKSHGAATPQQLASVGGSSAGFTNQRLAMEFVGPWALDYLLKPSGYTRNSPVKFRWGVALPPRGTRSGDGPLISAVVAMYKGAKNKRAAWWLLKFLTLGASTSILGTYGIAIPGDKRAANSAAFAAEYKPYTATWLAGQKRGRWMRIVPQEDAWWAAVTGALDPFWRNSTSVQSATASACSTASSYLP
ncbi:MAG TPA: extracellular solute-binding protein [Chloroflexota bacterium]